ncbi:MAG: hypothetical protein AVDCRST_MAG87-3665, partial [uncultured Thermomicrobiales bacterium]
HVHRDPDAAVDHHPRREHQQSRLRKARTLPGGVQLAGRRARDPLSGVEPSGTPVHRTFQDDQPFEPRDHRRRHPAEHGAICGDRVRPGVRGLGVRAGWADGARDRPVWPDGPRAHHQRGARLRRDQPRQGMDLHRAGRPPDPSLPRPRADQPGHGRVLQPAVANANL